MEKVEKYLITSAIITIVVAILVFFFDINNNHFQLRENIHGNTYISLKNGRYFSLLCENDVIDNGIDYTLKPFTSFNLETKNTIPGKEIICIDNERELEKKISFRRTPKTLEVRQEVKSNLEELGIGSYYYTHIEYPLFAEIEETEEYIKLYDLNCTTTIYKEKGYTYRAIDNFVRIGSEYSRNFNINFEMGIKCL